MREIVLYPNKILRTETKEIKEWSSLLEKDIADLIEVLMLGNGAGLAAVQIGLDKRFFGIKNQKTKKVKVYINPKVKFIGKKDFVSMVDKNGEKTDFLEGCLSFPGFWGTTKRFLEIEIDYQEIIDSRLIDKHERLKGYESVVWQHEFDHLNGIVFIDRVREDKGKFFREVGEDLLKVRISDLF